MARRTRIILVDDLDGTPADETVAFGIDGTSYEIDLSGFNASLLREALLPYVFAARRVTEPPRKAPAATRGRRRVTTMAEIEALKAKARSTPQQA